MWLFPVHDFSVAGMTLLVIVGVGSRACGSIMGGGGRQCRAVAGQISNAVANSWVRHGKACGRCEGGRLIMGERGGLVWAGSYV